MPKARCTSYTLAFKLKVIAEAEAVENNSEIARHYGLASRWSVAGDVTKESYSTASWRCVPDERRWAATSQNILSSINSCSSGLRSKEVKVRIHLSCLCVFSMKPKWSEFVTQLFDCERAASAVCIVSHFNSLVGTNTSDWLESCGVKTILSKQRLHSARSIYIFHSERNVIACVVLGIAVSERINVTSESEGTSKWSKASLGWYQNWKRRHSAERSKLWLNACPITTDDLENKICSFTASW